MKQVLGNNNNRPRGCPAVANELGRATATATASDNNNNDRNQCHTPDDTGCSGGRPATLAAGGEAGARSARPALAGGRWEKSCRAPFTASAQATMASDDLAAAATATFSHKATGSEGDGTKRCRSTANLMVANESKARAVPEQRGKSAPAWPLVNVNQCRTGRHCTTTTAAAGERTQIACRPQISPATAATTKRLLTIAAIVFLVEIICRHQQGVDARLATNLIAGERYLDSSCVSRRSEANSEAGRLLLALRCDLKPLYDQYAAAYGPDAAKTIGGRPEIGSDLGHLARTVDEFVDEGLTLLGLTDFCTYHTVKRMSKLKDMAAGSNLLSLAYDLVAIEFHRSCLAEIISKLPPVPYLVREVIKIYIEGADQKPVRHANCLRVANMNCDYDEEPFDVDQAIRRNGKLEHIVSLILTMPFGEIKTDAQIAEDFRQQCKRFLIEIEQRWDTGEMMSSMLTTEGNAIKSVNNYVMRTLTPTKFADICSQLSAKA